MSPYDGSAHSRCTRRRAARSSAERGISHMALCRAPGGRIDERRSPARASARPRQVVGRGDAPDRLGEGRVLGDVVDALAVEKHRAPVPQARDVVVTAAHRPSWRGHLATPRRVMTNHRGAVIRSAPSSEGTRPPLIVVFVAVLVIALGELGGRAALAAPARHRALGGRARRRQPRGPRALRLGRVRRGGPRPGGLRRRGGAVVLPHARRGHRASSCSSPRRWWRASCAAAAPGPRSTCS